MIIQFSGIALFSTIVNEVFSYKTEAKVQDMLNIEQKELTDLLYELSTTFDDKK